MRPPPSKHASKFGVIRLHFRKRTRTLTYEQGGGWQSTADVNGISPMRISMPSMGWCYNTPGKVS